MRGKQSPSNMLGGGPRQTKTGVSIKGQKRERRKRGVLLTGRKEAQQRGTSHNKRNQRAVKRKRSLKEGNGVKKGQWEATGGRVGTKQSLCEKKLS